MSARARRPTHARRGPEGYSSPSPLLLLRQKAEFGRRAKCVQVSSASCARAAGLTQRSVRDGWPPLILLWVGRRSRCGFAAGVLTLGQRTRRRGRHSCYGLVTKPLLKLSSERDEDRVKDKIAGVLCRQVATHARPAVSLVHSQAGPWCSRRSNIFAHAQSFRRGGLASRSLVARVDGPLGGAPSTSRSWLHFSTARASPSVSLQLSPALSPHGCTSSSFLHAKPRQPPICA